MFLSMLHAEYMRLLFYLESGIKHYYNFENSSHFRVRRCSNSLNTSFTYSNHSSQGSWMPDQHIHEVESVGKVRRENAGSETHGDRECSMS